MEQELARAPKTWGPFTGRQLTTIICVVFVTVMFPVGAWAVAGSNVFVTDAVSGAREAAAAARGGGVRSDLTGGRWRALGGTVVRPSHANKCSATDRAGARCNAPCRGCVCCRALRRAPRGENAHPLGGK